MGDAVAEALPPTTDTVALTVGVADLLAVALAFAATTEPEGVGDEVAFTCDDEGVALGALPVGDAVAFPAGEGLAVWPATRTAQATRSRTPSPRRAGAGAIRGHREPMRAGTGRPE